MQAAIKRMEALGSFFLFAIPFRWIHPLNEYVSIFNGFLYALVDYVCGFLRAGIRTSYNNINIELGAPTRNESRLLSAALRQKRGGSLLSIIVNNIIFTLAVTH